MKDLKDVYFKMQDKKHQKNELGKMIRDALSVNQQHKELTEEIKRLRDKKKGIENQVANECLADVQQLDTLKLEIAAANELLSDIALTMYANHENVEIVDEERGVRLTPVFNVKFQKEEMESEAAKSAAQRAASHPERTYKN
jgi:hypothetical protein